MNGIRVLLLIAVGGGLGSLLRYLLSGRLYSLLGIGFPWGTFVVNFVGAFLMGCIGEVFMCLTEIRELRVFLLIGLLGGFTTFSSYAWETVCLLRDGEWEMSLLNVLGTNLLCIAAVLLGGIVGRLMLEFFKRRVV